MSQMIKQHPEWVGGMSTGNILKGRGEFVGRVKSATGLISPEEAAFRTMVEQTFNQSMHDIFGARLTEPEIARAVEAMPNLKMSAPMFAASVGNTLKFIEQQKQSLIHSSPQLQMGVRMGTVDASAPTLENKIRVRRKSDNALGTINETDFDPQKYERVNE